MTYASVVSLDTFCLALANSALNDLDVKFRDVMNAYIPATIKEKVWTNLRPEFGNDAEKWALIVHDLYCLKSARSAFHAQLGRFMQGLGYGPCIADPD